MKMKRILLGAVAIVVTVAVITALLPSLLHDPAQTLYQDAQKLIGQADYVAAREKAQILIDQYPSDFYTREYAYSLLSECDYGIATNLKNNQQYAQAIEKYQQILTYPLTDMTDRARQHDAQQAIAAAYFEWAQQLQNQGNYEEALIKYQTVPYSGNYSQTQDAIENCHYAWITNLIATQNYDAAVEKYIAISSNYSLSYDWNWTQTETADILKDVPTDTLFTWATNLSQQKSYDQAITLYKTILKYNPDNQTIARVEKPLIETQLAKIEAGQHGYFPPPTQTQQSQQLSGEAQYTIINDTSYTLTVLLSGPSTTSIDVASHATETVTLKPGTYKVAAEVSKSSVIPYYGQITFNADSTYQGEYYIQTTIG